MRTLKPFLPLETAFPSLLKGMMPSMLWDETFAPPTMRLDVTEGEKAYTIKADIPGVKKEDIFVDVDGAVVTIRAEARRELPEGKEPNAIHTERNYGMVSRTVTLPLAVDLDATTAKYENGVLFLTLPKKSDASLHRVTIN